jgi:NAD dependent epimerase/dehydratase
MTLNRKKVAVTGAGGFIGCHLVEGLVEEGAKVKAYVHYNSRGSWGLLELLPQDILNSVQIVFGDIQDPFAVRRLVEGCDIVFHLAALIGIPYSYTAPQSYVATNINGTLNVLEACRDVGVERVIHTSTSETYGTALYTPIDEKHPLQAQSPYSASKIAADKLVQSYYLSFDVPVVTIRPFNNFGPRQSARAIIPTIMIQALTQPEIKLGSLTPVRDYVYVKDTVKAFIKSAVVDKAIGHVINIGSGKSSSIGDIVKIILRVMNIEKPIIQENTRIRPAKSEVMQLVCDNTLAQSVLKWEPTITFDEGLKQTRDWIKSNTERYKSAIYNV